MPFASLDTAAIARALSQLAEREDDLVDAFFERLETAVLPADGEAPGFRLLREEGLAVRFARDGRTWLAARDRVVPAEFSEALRQVARVLPSAPYPEPALDLEPWEPPPPPDRLAELALAVQRAIRARHAAFPLKLAIAHHRRDVQVVGPRWVPPPGRERFYSLSADLVWGRWGTLLPSLEPRAEVAAAVAERLVDRFRTRNAPPPEPGSTVVVLGPEAAAVLLHEAVAHALEADTLGLSGRPEAAVGVRMGPSMLHVLDDPGNAPEPVRQTHDDEGQAVSRRWLLREGVVEQPLADRRWSRESDRLLPGAGRRGGRHHLPGPRSTHLEILPGDTAEADLTAEADGGLYVAEAERGHLDPVSGRFTLVVAHARRIRGGAPADPVGAFRLAGSVAELLICLTAVGRRSRVAGAGWCAKGGRRLPVWAMTPALRLEGVEVRP